MPRVLHCIPSMGPGGAERQLALLAGGLMRLGWEVDVALRRGGPNLALLEASGAGIHWLGGLTDSDPGLVHRIRRVIRACRPDLVQTWLPPMDIFGGWACRKMHTPWILSELSTGAVWGERFAGVKNRLRVRLAREAAAVISNSQGGDAYWAGQAPGSVARRVIRNPVPLAEIARTDPAGRPAGADKVIVSVGRLIAEKNLLTLVAALRRVCDQAEAWAFLCGEGPQRRRIEAAVRQQGLENRVCLTGHVDDVWARLKAADVFVSVSRIEGHPNAVIEAMACGCPLVVSDIPAHREFLSSDSALLVAPDDPIQIADAIAATLSESAAARQRAKKARAICEQWSPQAIATEWLQVYQAALRK